MTATPAWNDDFDALIEALEQEGASFVIVGAHALAAHGIARATGDFDVLVRPSAENAERVWRALARFGAPVAAHGLSRDDLATEGIVYQIGLPPRRIDLLTGISGVAFDEAWATHVDVRLHGRELPVLGLDALITNKRAAGREKDLLDARMLELLHHRA